MKKLILFLMTAALALPLVASEETWKNAPIVDVMCSAKVKASPDEHTTKCALACVKSGFGIYTSDGSFLKFDQAGNEKVLAALMSTKKADHLRATVNGDRKGDTIQVSSFSLD